MQQTKAAVTCYLPPEIKAKLDDYCLEQGQTVSRVLFNLVTSHFGNKRFMEYCEQFDDGVAIASKAALDYFLAAPRTVYTIEVVGAGVPIFQKISSETKQ